MAEPFAIHGRRLARNSALTLATRGVGLLLGLVFVPLMVRSLGMELFGVLAITWMVLGQMGWVDLGLSAACTRFVARSLGAGRPDEAARWAWASIAAQVAIGGAAAALLWAAAPAIAGALQVSPETRPLVVLTLRVFGLMIPAELVTRSLVAVLEAAQRFDRSNALALFQAFWTNGVYLAGILRGGDFLVVVLGLAALRLVSTAAAFALARRILPDLRVRTAIREARALPGRVREMLGFGGWVTVNSAVGPLLLYSDRWLIGLLVGVAALPLYTVPFSLIMYLTVVPTSLTATLFPAFTALRAGEGWERAEEYYLRSHRYLAVLLVPLLFVLFVWAPELLRLWMGAEFASQASLVLRILLAGMTVGLLAPVSGAVLLGADRPDLLSRVYLLELPLNAVLMWTFVRAWGIEGAAAAFAARALLETTVLWAVVHRFFHWSWVRGLGVLVGRLSGVLVVFAAMAALLWQPDAHLPFALAVTAATLAVYAACAQRWLLDGRDRAFLLGTFLPGRGA